MCRSNNWGLSVEVCRAVFLEQSNVRLLVHAFESFEDVRQANGLTPASGQTVGFEDEILDESLREIARREEGRLRRAFGTGPERQSLESSVSESDRLLLDRVPLPPLSLSKSMRFAAGSSRVF